MSYDRRTITVGDGGGPEVTAPEPGTWDRDAERFLVADGSRDRCRDCGKVPGRWQPTVGGCRDELTLEECRTCGAAWTGRRG